MPVAHFHLVADVYTSDQRRELLTETSRAYAEVLDSPMDRVRTFIVDYAPEDVATAGVRVSDGGPAAPYFTAIVLAGRRVEQRQRLNAAFTDLIVQILGARRELVRGQIIEVDPANWSIGGSSAAAVRTELR
jgi:4-oxalocrotonate tautomerase family enzyme